MSLAPSSHDEFEIRDLERTHFEEKTGKSIMESIRAGDTVPEFLRKEFEQIVYSEMRDMQGNLLNKFKPEPELNPDEPDETGPLIKVGDEWKPEFDNSGRGIDYPDEDENN